MIGLLRDNLTRTIGRILRVGARAKTQPHPPPSRETPNHPIDVNSIKYVGVLFA